MVLSKSVLCMLVAGARLAKPVSTSESQGCFFVAVTLTTRPGSQKWFGDFSCNLQKTCRIGLSQVLLVEYNEVSPAFYCEAS